MDLFLRDIRRLADKFSLVASTYKLFNAHIKRSHRGSLRRRTIRIEKIEMLMEGQRRYDRCTMSNKVESTVQSVVYRISPKCMEEGAKLVKQIWALY